MIKPNVAKIIVLIESNLQKYTRQLNNSHQPITVFNVKGKSKTNNSNNQLTEVFRAR